MAVTRNPSAGGEEEGRKLPAREKECAGMEPEQGRGQILSGIPFHSGNTPASSVDSRLNLDAPVLEGGRGGEGTPANSQLLW